MATSFAGSATKGTRQMNSFFFGESPASRVDQLSTETFVIWPYPVAHLKLELERGRGGPNGRTCGSCDIDLEEAIGKAMGTMVSC